jgi:hypothetical protein
MPNKKEPKFEVQSPEYDFIKERIIRVLSLHEDSISIERLIRAVAQTTPPEFAARLSDLRFYVRSALFDLKMGGTVNSDTSRISLRRKDELSLRDVARCGNIRGLEKLLAEDIDQDEKNKALISAVINNQVEAAKVLLDAGADVNARDNLFDKTPMMYVTKRTSGEIVLLLSDSSNLEIRREGDDSRNSS